MLIKTILVPTDFSPHADAALDRALGLAKHFGAKIHLLHAYYFSVSVGLPDQYVMPPDLIEDVRRTARAQLEPLEKKIAEAGVDCTAHLSAQSPVAAIIELAESLPADLIVLGTRGLTGLKHVLLGSVAERTVRLAPCPVMTIKAEAH